MILLIRNEIVKLLWRVSENVSSMFNSHQNPRILGNIRKGFVNKKPQNIPMSVEIHGTLKFESVSSLSLLQKRWRKAIKDDNSDQNFELYHMRRDKADLKLEKNLGKRWLRLTKTRLLKSQITQIRWMGQNCSVFVTAKQLLAHSEIIE